MDRREQLLRRAAGGEQLGRGGQARSLALALCDASRRVSEQSFDRQLREIEVPRDARERVPQHVRRNAVQSRLWPIRLLPRPLKGARGSPGEAGQRVWTVGPGERKRNRASESVT